MKKKNTVYIDNKPYFFEQGDTILDVARKNDIDIPHLCYHPDLPKVANCRTCLVENLNKEEITTSCTLVCKDGMKVNTKSEEINRLRKTNLELVLAQHTQNCNLCQSGLQCDTADLMKKYGVTGYKYSKEKVDAKKPKIGSLIEIDPKLCIGCRKCTEACKKQGIGYLELDKRGQEIHVKPTENKHIDCIFCGQCTLKCPVNAIREQNQVEDVERKLNAPDKIVIAQMAPSVRTSIGEEFGFPIGTNLSKKMYTAFRKLGFEKVFDVNMGADITTMVEAEELIERIEENEGLPMFTSCCPSWVKFIEFYYPEFIPNLTTCRSPQIHSGAAYKTWWAQKKGIDPKNIVVVSIMPCTSKKFEAQLEKLKVNGHYPVDHVLTTRETADLLKKHNIDPHDLKDSDVDKYGEYTGAAAIYGASGGVMESALRTAAYQMTGKDLEKLEFEQVRGTKGIKKTTVTIDGKELRLAVVSNTKNARIILQEIKKKPKAYHYIEFMTCPGGCLGGGGQPLSSTEETVKERIKSLYKIDTESKIRKAHENPIVKEFFDYLDTLPEEKRKQILYTNYQKRS